MFMNDLNSDAPVVQNSAAPLKHDVEGRFSRHGKPLQINHKKIAFIENTIIALYIAFLLSTDFILFSGSGNIEVFRGSIFPIPEISYILLGFLAFSSAVIFLLRNRTVIKCCLASFITFALVFVLYRQFSMLQQLFSIGSTTIPVHTALGIGFAIICYGIFYYGSLFVRFLYMLASGVLFFHVYSAYINQTNMPEFLETYNSNKTGDGENKRFIYFMLPNLSSYAYLTTLHTNEATRTQNIMQGFYQKNNFTVYPKAFTAEDEFLYNMVRSLNPDSEKSSKSHILKNRLLSEYWRFYNIRRELINLKDNSLYDYFQNQGYLVSAYKSRDFDMCHKNHQINVDRCMEKINQPVNIYDIRLSLLSKINILLMEWLASMQIINNMSSVFTFVSNFVDLKNAPMVGIDYSNLYVVNSIKTFDVLLQNIKEDKGKQAYFVFVDLPSNMYIYNEFCQVKPTDDWYDIASLPWIKYDLTQQRQKAYLQQMRCLYGELEYFVQELRENNLLEDSTIVIQGTSGVNNFQNTKDPVFTNDFIANRSINMAIYDKQLQKHVDWHFCSANELLMSFLSGKNKCQKQINLGIHEKFVKGLDLKLGRLASGISNDVSKNFEKWFESWITFNQDKKQIWIEKTVSKEKKAAEKSKKAENVAAAQAENETAQNTEADFDEFGL